MAETTLPMILNVMRNFYTPLKDCDPCLKFVFITGITRKKVFTPIQGNVAIMNNMTKTSHYL